MNTVGTRIKLTLTGASHAPSVGFILCGLPKGLSVDLDGVMTDLARRSAKNHSFATKRREADDFVIASGIMDGVTDGGPIRVSFPNREHLRSEYRLIARPSHADYAAFVKSGGREDISGGGKYSGRMTLPLTFAGSLCRGFLKEKGVEVFGHVAAIGSAADAPFDPMMTEKPELDTFFPLVDPSKRAEMEAALLEAHAAGDTLSCEAETAVLGLPVGFGEPLFDGLEGTLAKYLFMIPGLRALEFGEIAERGSLMNDGFTWGGGTVTNNSRGINGGMANGMPVMFRARFRPVPSIKLPQTGYDLLENRPVPLEICGRHDVCILPRGLAAVEAAACLALTDLWLMGEANENG